MSDTWIILKPERTRLSAKYERCMICYATDCELIGVYGTYNLFGSFKGVCNRCLKRLNETKAEG